MSQAKSDTNRGLILGYTKGEKANDTSLGFGFLSTSSYQSPSDHNKAVKYNDEGHLLTIAPTGAGKGVSCVIPAILEHDGPVVVMDLKGENFAITRKYRESIGSKVSCIDPFGVAAGIINGNEGSDASHQIAGFNPLDLLPYLSDDRDTACRSLAQMLVAKDSHKSDPFWGHAAIGVIAALIECYDSYSGPMRSISSMVRDLSIDVEEALVPGQISIFANAYSYLSSNIDLVERLEDAGLTIELVCEIYESVCDANTGAATKEDVGDIAMDAALTALTWRASNKDDTKTDEEICSLIANAMAEDDLFQQFTVAMCMQAQVDALEDDLVISLWETLEEGHKLICSTPEPGSYGHQFSSPISLENYPLALHRMAKRSSQMCRSAASQPVASDKTWGSVLMITRSELEQFSGRSVAKTLGGSTGIDLEALRRGDDLSVYIAFPPARIRSHSTLFKVITEGMLTVILSRSSRPEKRTLFLLDEIAQLGNIDLLVTAKTLLRGYGVQVWSFWQDISQIQSNYPADWKTILNNCRVIQVFGKGTGIMTSDITSAMDVPPGLIQKLANEDLLTWVDGKPVQLLRRVISHEDPLLKGRCGTAPFVNQGA